MKHATLSRRHFFFGSMFAAAVPAGGFGAVPGLGRLGYKSPNEKLNVAAIGAGGKGRSDIAGCSSENIAAFADPDAKQAGETFEKYPKVPRYTDFRKMLDKEDRNIDAVIVATPDFMHGTATMWAMERGKAVYCQKPLTRTIWEARELAKGAEKYGVATQMGNQGYSNDGARQAAEIVWSGEIGDVTEVHAWTNRPLWPQGVVEIPPPEDVPSTIDWDAWIGIAADRPYSSEYAPFKWRGWYDFGCGALGDMACHILGSVNMALLLEAPTSVEVLEQTGKNPYTFPTQSVIRFDFPARKTMPAVQVYWHDGAEKAAFRPKGVPEGERVIPVSKRAEEAFKKREGVTKEDWARFEARSQSNGAVFVGSKGLMATDTYAGSVHLMPEARMKDFEMPDELLTRSPGHYRDWIRAAKGGDPACSNFSIAAPFTEWILLGALALRFEGKLEWDREKMKVTNHSEANEFIRPEFRKGWSWT
jgi:predicted dehydrogenase